MSRRSNTNMFALLDEDAAPASQTKTKQQAAPPTPIKIHAAPVPNAPARPSPLRRVAYGWTPPPVAKPVVDPLADFPVLAGTQPKQQTAALSAWAAVASTKPKPTPPKPKQQTPAAASVSVRRPVMPSGLLPSYHELFPERKDYAPLPDLVESDSEDDEVDDGWD